jgi:hypothetical protein
MREYQIGSSGGSHCAWMGMFTRFFTAFRAKLGNLLTAGGFKDVHTKVKTWHFDNRDPGKRKEAIDYWSELLLSGADALVQAKYVDELTVKEAEKELKAVARDPNAVFFYSFIQATATT